MVVITEGDIMEGDIEVVEDNFYEISQFIVFLNTKVVFFKLLFF